MPRFGLGEGTTIAPIAGGLINHTCLITTAAGARFVLQRVNPLFPPDIHENIAAVSAALQRAGLVTPALVPTTDGAPCLQLLTDAPGAPPAVWRLMTHVQGTSFDVVTGAAQARAAGRQVARFHAALDGLPHRFIGLRANVHDTARHLTHLRDILTQRASHPLFAPVAALSREILGDADRLPPLPPLPARICHGDLKINNFLFAGASPPESDQAICLVDLDTVGPMALAFELGDAWRSWCNTNGEDEPEARLDLGLFEASLDGYVDGLGRALTTDERRALLLGPEWISLELSARFAADALTESYFGWNPLRFPSRGDHNLIRAQGQLSLHRALTATRQKRAGLLNTPP